LGIQTADRIRILASDISACSLQTAGQAAYPAERFRELPPDWLPKYLLRGCGRQEGWCRVKPLVRRMIKFRRLNLMEIFRPALLFHVIFCRNAMIYFDKPTQVELVSRLSACLEPGGYLLIGHSETLNGMRHPYQYVKPSVYRKPVSS
jgi:chemotaxis protein methyltransferase CheR